MDKQPPFELTCGRESLQMPQRQFKEEAAMGTLCRLVFCTIVYSTMVAGYASGADAIPRAQIATLTKPATALVDARPKGLATAFCIHSSGLFVTNEHVVREMPAEASIKLILDSGLKSQRTIMARIVKRDRTLDLCLLLAESPDNFASLVLGSEEGLTELTELFVFGFPFGTSLGRSGEYPTVSVNAVNVSSLRRDATRELHRIQVDSNLNPGNSGGPVIDSTGKVVGVVVSGILGAGINLAIPVSHVRRFVDQPIVALKPPVITPKNKYEAADFAANVSVMGEDSKSLEVELALRTANAPERVVPMKFIDGEYRAKVAPFSGSASEQRVKFELSFQDGAVAGSLKNRVLRIGGDNVELVEIKSLKPGNPAEAELHTGRKLRGPVTVGKVDVQVGEQTVVLQADKALEIKNADKPEDVRLGCSVIVRKAGREIGRHHENVYLAGIESASLAAIGSGKFIKPLRADTPRSYLKAISTAGDYIGQGQTLSFEDAGMTVTGSPVLVKISVGGWTATFAAPQGTLLKAGRYPNAKRHPFNDNFPGLDFTGYSRGSNRVGGEFVVWEYEVEGKTVKRLAVDFIHRSEVVGPPLYGMIRYNSTFE